MGCGGHRRVLRALSPARTAQRPIRAAGGVARLGRVQMTNSVPDLSPHPRLHLEARAPRADGDAPGPVTARLARTVAAAADSYLCLDGVDEVPSIHNGHLVRAREMQRRILTLLAHWVRSGDQRHRDAVVAHIEAMGRWGYWSSIAWRRDDARPDAIFDLSYGENSATLAMAYDVLYNDLDAAERDRMVTIARVRALQPFLQVVGRAEAWWLGKHDTNWNSVCVGGAGMLALSMAEELPEEAAAVLPLVEESMAPFMRSLEATDGGWPEGIGYWAYGMRYAFHYLLSHERATGARHQLLRAEATKRTVEFPLDFWPHGQACSFGDSNHFGLAPVHVLVAELLGCGDVVRAVRPLIDKGAFESAYEWRAHAAEALLLGLHLDHPAGEKQAVTAAPDGEAHPGAVRVYTGIGWTRMADRWPDPSFYVAIRGGLSGVPHGHRDLLSFHAVVGQERLIENLTPGEYLDTTFGPRREELFEMGPQSKNVPLINGVGVINDVRVDPELLEIDGLSALRLDATQAMGLADRMAPLADHCTRTFVFLGSYGAVVLDRIRLIHSGRVETRLHTRGRVAVDGARAAIAGSQEYLGVAHAAWTPERLVFGLDVAPTTPTTPGDDATMLRWHGPRERGRDHVLATLLAPGADDVSVRILEVTERSVRLDLSSGVWSRELSVPLAGRAG